MTGGLYNPRPVDDTPVNGQVQHGVTSNWAFDHAADVDAHHPEEIPDGRGYYNTTYLHTIPGVTSFGTYGQQALVADRIYYFPIYVRTPITIDEVIIEVTGAAGAGEKCRIAVYSADKNWQPVTRQVASAEIAIDANAVLTTAITETVLQEGRYLIAITLEGNTTVRAMRSYDCITGLAADFAASFAIREKYVAAAYAELPVSGTAWDTVTTSTLQTYYPVILQIKTP